MMKLVNEADAAIAQHAALGFIECLQIATFDADSPSVWTSVRRAT